MPLNAKPSKPPRNDPQPALSSTEQKPKQVCSPSTKPTIQLP